MMLDETDKKILNELMKDSQTPLREIALKLRVSFVTVRNRIRRLEKERIITGYHAKINYDELDFDIHVMIDVRIAKGKLLELEKKIAKNPNIYAVYDTTGHFDAILMGRFSSTRRMDTFLKNLQQYDFIERTNTRLVLHTIKNEQIKL